MKIVYSPYFGSRPYVDLSGRGGVLFNEKPVGTPALLEELEIRTGNTGIYVPETERLISYVKAMREAVSAEPGLFFAESFALDEIGTARVILAWRDVLVMALWDPAVQDSEKLHGIAAVEPFFGVPGYVDRWRSLLDFLKQERPVIAGLEMECRVPLLSLELVVREVLMTLGDIGVPVEEKVCSLPQARPGTALRRVQEALLGGGEAGGGKKEALPGDDTFRHIHFSLAYDAYQWAAQESSQWNGPGDLMVCPHPAAVNDTLRVVGRPLLQADIDGAPQSLQLFLLGLSLFHAPVDVDRLLSYLRVPVNPLGKLCLKKEGKGGESYYRPLHKELAEMLLDKGGLDGWDEVIEKAVYDRDGAVVDRRTREEVLGRFFMWKKVDEGGNISQEDILAYLRNLRRWADGCAQVIDADPGFAALSGCCAAMEMLADATPGVISSGRLIRWAEGLFTPVRIRVEEAQAESPDCIEDIRGAAAAPERVWCVGFNAIGGGAYPYSFLSEEESRLVGVPPREDFARFDHMATAGAITAVKESLTLVSFDFEDGSPTTEHPVLTELRSCFDFPTQAGEELEPADASYQMKDSVPDETRQTEYQLDPKLFKGLDKTRAEGGIRPNRESYSSVDQLIQFPFDYVLEKLLGFDSYGEAQLSDLPTVKGNVAHLYVQTLVGECDGDLSRMEEAHRTGFGERVLRCAETTGAILLVEENALEWGKFRHILRRSVSALLELIRRNGFTVYGSEEHLETVFPVIGPFHAYVDLLLKDAQGRWVIFDFKWSEGKSYENKMEKRDIIQLILYKEAVERSLGGEVSVYGYWVFPRYQFLTESDSVVGDGVITYRTEPGTPEGEDIFQQVCNSYTFRMEQIRKGFVEEGESFYLSDLYYFQNQVEENLYPLRGDYYDPTVKARPYGNQNSTLKGGLL